jgi:hypothetical protein
MLELELVRDIFGHGFHILLDQDLIHGLKIESQIIIPMVILLVLLDLVGVLT